MDLSLNLESDDHREVLRKIRNELDRQRKAGILHILKLPNLIPFSAGHVLQFDINFKGKLISVDILINRYLELLNTDLVRTYCLADSRFLKLATVLKMWNKTLDSDKFKRLNSYSVYMLLLAVMIEHNIMPNITRNLPDVQGIFKIFTKEYEHGYDFVAKVQYQCDINKV